MPEKPVPALQTSSEGASRDNSSLDHSSTAGTKPHPMPTSLEDFRKGTNQHGNTITSLTVLPQSLPSSYLFILWTSTSGQKIRFYELHDALGMQLKVSILHSTLLRWWQSRKPAEKLQELQLNAATMSNQPLPNQDNRFNSALNNIPEITPLVFCLNLHCFNKPHDHIIFCSIFHN